MALLDGLDLLLLLLSLGGLLRGLGGLGLVDLVLGGHGSSLNGCLLGGLCGLDDGDFGGDNGQSGGLLLGLLGHRDLDVLLFLGHSEGGYLGISRGITTNKDVGIKKMEKDPEKGVGFGGGKIGLGSGRGREREGGRAAWGDAGGTYLVAALNLRLSLCLGRSLFRASGPSSKGAGEI